MKKRLLFLCLILSSYSNAQISDWLLSVDSGASVQDIATDQDGFIYCIGATYGAEYAIKINGNSYKSPHLRQGWDANFLAKLDSAGNVQWVKFLGSYWLAIRNVSVDGLGNVIIKGIFADSLQIENDTMIAGVKPPNQVEGCLIKFDKNGNFIWATLGPILSIPFFNFNPTYLSNSKIVTDASNNIYLMGDTALYYPLNGTSIFKYNSSGILMNSFSTPNPIENYDFTIDQFGNAFATYNRLDSLTGFSITDTILIKYDSNGSPLSALRASSMNVRIVRMEYKGAFLYATGTFSGNAITIGGKTIYSSMADRNYFIMKLEPWTNTIFWLKTLSCNVNSPGTWQDSIGGYDFKVSAKGEVFLAGTWQSSVCFQENYFYENSNKTNSFLIKLSDQGSLVWQKNIFSEQTRYISSHSKSIWANSLILNGHNVYLTLNNFKDSTYTDDGKGVKGGRGIIYKVVDDVNKISGKTYIDLNASGGPDAGDIFTGDQLISISGPKNTLTRKNGKYELYSLRGSFTIDYINPPKYYTHSPLTHSAVFTGLNQTDTLNHFALNPVGLVQDVSIHLTPTLVKVPWSFNESSIYLNIKNVGTTNTANDTITLYYTSRLVLDSISRTPLSQTKGKIKWLYSTLKPLESDVIFVNFLLDSIDWGDTLFYRASIGPISVDTFPQDNIDSVSQRVISSYDPNDKQVQPEGIVNTEYASGGNYFTYTVRFQNTGNDTARYVWIRDTMPKELDLTSFEMLASSHSYEIENPRDHVFDFIFKKIMLPDNKTNELLSHGYLKFRFKTIAGLKGGDYFDNKAYIFFDANEPIITNTVHSELKDYLNTVKIYAKHRNMLIYPNPAESEFNIKLIGSNSQKANLFIRDLAGRIVYHRKNMAVIGDEIQVRDLHLSQGIYFVEVRGEMLKLTSKLIVN